ncbi:MAG: BadF/BadG/BcrA/BcrD ATPase family protein [Pseudomonadota bacterium]
MAVPALLGIAIDGGGSQTRLRLIAADGTPLAEGRGGPANLSFGAAPAWAAITAALDRALATIDLSCRDLPAQPLATVAAIAGSLAATPRADFVATKPAALPLDVELIGDGEAALTGALAGEPGTVVAVGTGTVALRAHADGRVAMVDGWGLPAGDEGSGAWIGVQAIRELLRHRDGRRRADGLLVEALAATLDLGDDAVADERLREWLRAATSSSYASLAPTVVEADRAGDPAAQAIIVQAGAAVDLAVHGLDGNDPASAVAVVGGMAAALSPHLAPDVRRRLVAARGTALDGATIRLRKRVLR